MVYNDLGTIVDKQINWLSNQYPYLLIHNAIVMPNHVHLLMEIVGDKLALDEMPDIGDDWRVVGTGRDLSVLKNMISRDNVDRSRPVPTLKIKSISELIGAFKTTSSKLIHEAGITDFKWNVHFTIMLLEIKNRTTKSTITSPKILNRGIMMSSGRDRSRPVRFENPKYIGIGELDVTVNLLIHCAFCDLWTGRDLSLPPPKNRH